MTALAVLALLAGVGAAAPAPATDSGPLFADPVLGPARGPAVRIAADFNGDGRADLAVAYAPGMKANERPPDEVWISDGRGGFAVTQLPTRAAGLAAGDLDGDGDQDLVATLRNRDRFAVLRGDGRGGFAPPRLEISGGWGPGDVAATDLDLDGDIDLAIAHRGSDDVVVLVNDGRGALSVLGRVRAPMHRFDAMHTTDVDGDGAADLVAVQRGDLAHRSTIAVARNDGSARFAEPVRVDDVPSYLGYVAFGDTDADGRPDLVVSARDSLDVRRGDGAGRFGRPDLIGLPCAPRQFPAPAWACGPGALAVGNLDGDGRPQVVWRPGEAPRGLAVGDVDGDGDLDLVTLLSKRIAAIANDGSGTFTRPRRSARVPGDPYVIALADLDGDGVLHAVLHEVVDRSDVVSVLRGDGTGRFSGAAATATGHSGWSFWGPALALGDADGDTDIDVVLDYSRLGVAILRNDGRGTLSAPDMVPTGVEGSSRGPGGVAVADADSDGRADLVVTDPYRREVRVLAGNGRGTFGPPRRVPTGGAHPSAVTVAEVSGDGLPDIVVAHLYSHEIAVLPGTGLGGFGEPVHEITAGLWPSGLAVADVDGDGASDVLAHNSASGLVSVHRNTSALARTASAARP